MPRRFEVLFGSERARAGAAARPRPRRRAHALREDRPHRRRPVRRARDRAGLQVRQARALARARSRASCACRSRSTCSCCAISSGSSRSAALYRPLAGERKARGLLRASEGDTLKGYARNDYLDEEAFWGAVDDARDTARTPRAAHPRRRRRARPEGRRVPGVVRPLADLPGASARERAAAGSRRGDGRGLRLRRRRHGQDGRARRALRARGVRPRARRRLDPRHHVHAPRGRRAAHAHPRRARRARAARPRARARRRVDLDDPRLLPSAAEGVSVRRRARSALPRARRRAGSRASERVVPRRRSTSSARTDDPDRLRLLATYGADGLRRMLTGVYETLRSAGRDARRSTSATRPQLDGASRSCARRRAASSTMPSATDNQRTARDAAARAARARHARPTG